LSSEYSPVSLIERPHKDSLVRPNDGLILTLNSYIFPCLRKPEARKRERPHCGILQSKRKQGIVKAFFSTKFPDAIELKLIRIPFVKAEKAKQLNCVSESATAQQMETCNEQKRSVSNYYQSTLIETISGIGIPEITCQYMEYGKITYMLWTIGKQDVLGK
jgi:hypothetical protein